MKGNWNYVVGVALGAALGFLIISLFEIVFK